MDCITKKESKTGTHCLRQFLLPACPHVIQQVPNIDFPPKKSEVLIPQAASYHTMLRPHQLKLTIFTPFYENLHGRRINQ